MNHAILVAAYNNPETQNCFVRVFQGANFRAIIDVSSKVPHHQSIALARAKYSYRLQPMTEIILDTNVLNVAIFCASLNCNQTTRAKASITRSA